MTSTTLSGAQDAHFTIRKIAPADLKEALIKGVDDFKAMPSHLAFLVAIYPLATLIAGMAAARSEFLPLVFPLLSGFALIGPLVAIGLYEISRRREQRLVGHMGRCLSRAAFARDRRDRGSERAARTDLSPVARRCLCDLSRTLRRRVPRLARRVHRAGLHHIARSGC